MSIGRWRRVSSVAGAALLGLAVLAGSVGPASAQNRKRAWEIFIYFGEYAGQTVPSAIQKGLVSTYRLDPSLAYLLNADPNGQGGTPFCEICRNSGVTGPDTQFLGSGSTPIIPCPSPRATPEPAAIDPNSPYLDECDDDFEAVYKYNAKGIVTNGEVQRNDSEFLLGGRLGYNVTRHWEVEMDLGFGKQRLDMTKNLLPLLSERVSNPADPWFDRLAEFYEFTWANRDFYYLGYQPLFGTDPNAPQSIVGLKEIPNVPQHRFSKNPAADIPAMLPMPFAKAEKFEDVTDFVNRVFLDPGAFRNRANQINIDIFSAGLTGLYNFNTKPDSRIVPYLAAGMGRWIRSYDAPYEGENSDYLTYGGGVRFFVNEIFSFRAELRGTVFRQETSAITASLPRQDLIDVGGAGGCLRDQEIPAQQPPQECDFNYIQDYQANRKGHLPARSGAGGYARIDLLTETDDFWEARIGFDVLLGGK